jgi:hypothetical protein
MYKGGVDIVLARESSLLLSDEEISAISYAEVGISECTP